MIEVLVVDLLNYWTLTPEQLQLTAGPDLPFK